MLGVFKKPYPFTVEYKKRLLSIFIIAVFVFLFLYVFKPFGLSRAPGNILLITFAYGAVTFIVGCILSVIVPVVYPAYFYDEKWNTGKETLFIIFLIACIATGNMILGNFFGFVSLSFSAYLNVLLITISVAVIPVFVAILIKQNFLLQKNLNSAKQLTNELYHKKRLPAVEAMEVIIHAENAKDDLQLPPDSIYYLKAAENYVEVFYKKEGPLQKKLLRATLKGVHDDLKLWSQFYRCHRTCIVNLEKVERVTGNAQGYRLVLKDLDETAPVSRSLNKDITLRLKR